MFGSWFVNPVGGHAQDGWEEFLPGLELAQEENLTAKHPVVIMPGITSTHLEVWNSKSVTDKVSCGLKYFRRRLWGTLNQIRAILLDKACWFEHMSLDPKTGLDPPGIKLRAAQGLDAADYLFPGYYVLARIIANLATIGYDNNNSSCFPKQHMASYDWRLSYTNLEARDQYFTKLKMTIETAYRSNMKPHTPHGHEEDHSRVVVISHSMGSLIFHYFLQWVESDLGGKGGRGWVDKHLKTWVNIAGPTLGSPKTVPSVVSGELRDIVNLNTYASYVLEQLFSRREVRFLFRNWGGLSSLAPKGGETIWGSAGEDAPDDLDGTGKFSTIMEIVGKRIEERPSTTLFPIPGGASSTPVVPQDDGTGDAAAGGAEKAGDGVGTDGVGVSRNVTAGGLKSFLDGVVPEYSDRWDAEYATHIATTWSEIQAAPQLPRNWVNPLLCPLPRVKDRKEEGKKFKIVCEYGVGIPTERKYFFADYGGPDASERYFIHQQHQEPGLVENGVLLTDGDATVALISLGYMCAEGWRRKRYNPSNVPVIVREHLETASTSMKGGGIQGGPGSANHVDIMGNHAVIEDILRIASGIDELEDRYHSRIREIAARVKLPEMYYDARWPDASPAKN
ncbi:hypothetical protein HK101_005719 [Irineochytrium annulatum]|nr:hypothetical protein HK101_005719 [Irineochytrium annulatum]